MDQDWCMIQSKKDWCMHNLMTACLLAHSLYMISPCKVTMDRWGYRLTQLIVTINNALLAKVFMSTVYRCYILTGCKFNL
jgi:hypothetical protein